MNKQAFLAKLRQGLSGFPSDDLEERILFYSEMIDDRMEEGLSESEAVQAIGPVETVVSQIVEEIPLSKLVKEKMKPRKKLGAWEVILLVLGSPIWLSLLIAVFAVAFSLYVVLWSVSLSLWAVFVSLVACVIGGLTGGIAFLISGHSPIGMITLAAGIVCAGLSIFMFYGCKATTKGILILTKKIAVWVKHRFMRKEEPQCGRKQ